MFIKVKRYEKERQSNDSTYWYTNISSNHSSLFYFFAFFLILIYKGRYTLETYTKNGWEILQESNSSKANLLSIYKEPFGPFLY